MIMNRASPVHVGPWHGLRTCKLCLDRLGPWRGIDPRKPSGHWRGINPRKPWPGSLQSYQYYYAKKMPPVGFPLSLFMVDMFHETPCYCFCD